MPRIEHLLLFLVSLLAFLVKAMSGFGPALVLVAVGSLVVSPHSIIPASSLLDSLAGLLLLRTVWSREGARFWAPISVSVLIASVVGGLLLDSIRPEPLETLLGMIILLLGIWFLAGRSQYDGSQLSPSLPKTPARSDYAFSMLGGFSGGLLGISGPPIIWHFGRRFAKAPFRRAVIPLFLCSASARAATYLSVGLVDGEVLSYVGACLPGLLLGLYAGNRVFVRISEETFSRIIGVLLISAAIRLLG